MAQGDALFFDAYTPHYSDPNRSRRSRRMAFLSYNPTDDGDHRASYFAEKRKRQPPMDERCEGITLVRDAFGKLVIKESENEK